jgi:hypothetical protein
MNHRVEKLKLEENEINKKTIDVTREFLVMGEL